MDEERRNDRAGPERRLPVWALVLLDLFCLVAALNVFALFHHVLPRASAAAEKPVSATPAPAPVPAASPASTPAPPAAVTAGQPEEPEPAEEKTGWAGTFADHFTDEVVVTENAYSSPDVSVTVDSFTVENGNHHNVVCVADIYVTDVRCFRTYLANDTFGRGIVEDILDMAADAGAVAAMTGDFYSYQGGSLVLRNGVLYRDGKWQENQDHCVLYYDGSMVTYGPNALDLEEAMANGAWQIWTFGPALLDGEGNVPEKFDPGGALNGENPRSAVGYYEPGHYCFVVVDGRRPSYSYGMTFRELAEVFQGLGCKAAYNLDGGGSAAMSFMDRLVNVPSGGGRDLSDILLVGELPAEEEAAEP